MKRFEIWEANLPDVAGSHVQHGRRHLCVIVSNDAANAHSPVVTIVPLSSKLRKKRLPTHVPVHAPALTQESFAVCEQIITLDKANLISTIGCVQDSSERIQLERALEVQLGIAAVQKEVL